MGRRIGTALPDGARIEGDVLAVRADVLILDIRKTSNRQAYPKGQFSIPRTSLSSVKLIRTQGSGGVVGGVLGAMAGLGLSVLGASTENTAIATTGYCVVLPVGIVAGYHLGKLAARRPLEIKILAEPSSGEQMP